MDWFTLFALLVIAGFGCGVFVFALLMFAIIHD